MENFIAELNSPLFESFSQEEIKTMLNCVGYHLAAYKKGQIVAFEEDEIKSIGIILSGRVDMIKEDLWGNKTVLVRMGKNELFGETFACGADKQAVVSFVVYEDARILLLPFERVMHSCNLTCPFHHKLIENMVGIMAAKSRDLMRKIEVTSKRSIREKILTYLSIQSQQQGSNDFEVPTGRVELAEYLCVDRSALTRELAKMKDEGLIDYNKNHFRLL